MKNRSAAISLAFDARLANLPQTVAIVVLLSVMVGVLLTDSTDEIGAYLLVCVACGAPIVLWILLGTRGIPVLPMIAAMSFLFYAVPILRHNFDPSEFEPLEILSAAFTMTLFLGAATLSWWLLLAMGARPSRSAPLEGLSVPQLKQVMFIGLALGLVFHVGIYAGWMSFLGPAFGLVRAAMLTAAMAACFMLGHLRARGSLQGQNYVLAVAGLGMMVILSWASLFLVVGMTFGLAAVFGYVITNRRVPWIFVSVAMSVLIVLHAGKEQMRAKFWLPDQNYGAEISITQVPALMEEWVEAGFTKISSNETHSSIVDRASLLPMLMRVQRLAPDYVPFLEGRSYAVLPEMLIPRFIDPDKTASQAAMIMLNVHFGIQTLEGTRKTAVGWGLPSEAFANFGRLGVVGVGFILGLLCGAIERWSARAPLISLPGLVAIVAMLDLINPEADAAGLVTTLFQSVTAIAIFYWIFETLNKQKRKRNDRSISTYR